MSIYLCLRQGRGGSVGLNGKDGGKSRLGVALLEVGTDLLCGGLDGGDEVVVGEGIFRDEFVGRDRMVFIVLVYVEATEGHGQ